MRLIITLGMLLLSTFGAEARHYRQVQRVQQSCFFFAPCIEQVHRKSQASGPTTNSPSRSSDAGASETMLAHPEGCPRRAFCGCGASIEAFGHSIRSLWLAANWFRFPKVAAASGMAIVRRHHVAILRSHIQGNVWMVADYNSGGHRSRLHARSIAGFTVVNPHS